MTLDGMQRVLAIHAEWLKRWRERLHHLENSGMRHFTKGPSDHDWVDVTDELIDELKQKIAMIEELDRQYRP